MEESDVEVETGLETENEAAPMRLHPGGKPVRKPRKARKKGTSWFSRPFASPTSQIL